MDRGTEWRSTFFNYVSVKLIRVKLEKLTNVIRNNSPKTMNLY